MKSDQHPWLQWYPGALALARQILNGSDEAADIVQTAYLKSFQNVRLPNEAKAQRAWLLKVVRNACIDVLRGQKKFADSEQNTDVEVDCSPEQSWLQDSRKQRVHQALTALPIDMREILVLRELNELAYDDIAKVLRIERGTVMSRLHRARMALRKKLQGLENERGEV
ncbi:MULTISPECIES: sigma-70 family RNA polymerase sigma factor [Gammaproteobacteria]|uniref:sigma-70 family RNA polymerase sigma factor n=1 Tax=Gammaproteobacteria TaxID=1236 RepID=UPI001403AA1E|nr:MULTISPECIES: sigma-70 family RNA polymerase sigma factor [Gammaproteobacteria]